MEHAEKAAKDSFKYIVACFAAQSGYWEVDNLEYKIFFLI